MIVNNFFLKVETFYGLKASIKEQTRRQQTHEIRMSIFKRDNDILNDSNKSQEYLVKSTSNYIEKIHTNDNVLLKKYSILELLTGISIYPNNITEQSWFSILFTNLTNQFFDLESEWLQCGEKKTKLKEIVCHLSRELQDSYLKVFKVKLIAKKIIFFDRL